MSRRILALGLVTGLAGCEREPDLHGYWDIATIAAGATEDAAEPLGDGLAGSLEFTRDAEAYGVYAYTWTGALTPDPTPDVVVYTWSFTSSAPDDFSYVDPGETFSLTVTHPGTTDVYEVLDWKGSSVRLRSELAAPPPATYDTPQMFVELTLER